MARDRFVYFNQDKRPTKREMFKILENYCKGSGIVVRHRIDRWLIDIPGSSLNMFAGLPNTRPLGSQTRFIEVHYAFDPLDEARDNNRRLENIDVITRAADQLTRGIANELAQSVAQFYVARLEDK